MFFLSQFFCFDPFLSDKRSWLRVWGNRRILLLLLLLLVWIKAHQDHESSPLCSSNLGFTELDLNLKSDLDYSPTSGSDRVASDPVWTGLDSDLGLGPGPFWSWFREVLLSSCLHPGLVRSRWSSGWTGRGGTGRWRSSTPWAPSWAGLDHNPGERGVQGNLMSWYKPLISHSLPLWRIHVIPLRSGIIFIKINRDSRSSLHVVL